MANRTRSEIIKGNPIGRGLDAFRDSFGSICEDKSISCTPDAVSRLGDEDVHSLALNLLSAFLQFPATRLLRSKASHNNLQSDLLRLISAVASGHFDFDRIRPRLNAILTDKADSEIWDEVDNAVTEPTPSPQPIASSLQQTPWLHKTSSFANSSEHRQDVNRVLKLELGPLFVGLPEFRKTYFGRVAGLEIASEAVFKKCTEGSHPLFSERWSGWPKDANQNDVLSWFADVCEKLAAFAKDYKANLADRRRPVAQPNKPIHGSTGERKLDVGFVDDPKAGKYSRCHWSQILVPGELKSNPLADKASKAWLDLGTYARKVLAAQDSRRFVLGFTLCGSLMRIWEFDRLGGIASEHFDVNEDGPQFVSTILGFLWMSEEELGFDPTFMTANDKRFIDIQRDGSTECWIRRLGSL